MSLLQRKPRPILARDKVESALRDDRLFIIACDDTYAPKQYFSFFRLPRVQVHVVETVDGTSSPGHVLDRLLNYEHEEDDERWMLLDTDHLTQGTHLRGLMRALQDAERAGVSIALSKPCFELWLLLHHCDTESVTTLTDATEVEATLRDLLGTYNKSKLKPANFPAELVAAACNRAELLDATDSGGLIPNVNTSRVYLLWRAIILKSLPTQLPLGLHGLVKRYTTVANQQDPQTEVNGSSEI